MKATSAYGVEVDGGKIRLLRKLAGFTQKSLARACGLSACYISQIETGARRTISPPRFVQLCNTLEISAKDRQELLRTDDALRDAA